MDAALSHSDIMVAHALLPMDFLEAKISLTRLTTTLYLVVFLASKYILTGLFIAHQYFLIDLSAVKPLILMQ